MRLTWSARDPYAVLRNFVNPVGQTFKRAERLSSKRVVDRLFAKGSAETKSVFGYPFRVLYLPHSEGTLLLPAVLISVSKRHFKKAVDRNLIKRRIREAYRLNKNLLVEKEKGAIPAYIAFLYVAKEILSFEELEKKLKFVLKQIG